MNHNKLVVCPLCARILKGREKRSDDLAASHNASQHESDEIARVFEWTETGLDDAYRYAKSLRGHPDQTPEQHERLMREFIDTTNRMEE